MLGLIITCLVWVVIPILFGICVVHIILGELDAEKRSKAHRKNLLEAINTSNMDKEDKAEIVCKFGDCGGK